jgi:farnesyl-diphosphate farnesyltransferase
VTPSPNATGPGWLLGPLLKQVSRSFYLTLQIVPSSVRAQVGVAYLFARAADTIADTDVIEQSRRLSLLKQFQARFSLDLPDGQQITAIQREVLPHQGQPAERLLLERLPDCFALYEGLAPADRLLIRQLLETLTRGMEMDLTVFRGGSAHALTALETMDDLDRYIYSVAGCVGDFWTRLTQAHIPALAGWDTERMAATGVRFGKGLQLTNVLKDLPRDLQRGRCYIPRTLLQPAGLAPEDLLKPDRLPAFRPVLLQLIALALDHLDQGWLYTLAIPRREVRLRLACMWPILLAVHTLRQVAASPTLLNPAMILKVPRRQVYGILALTTLTAACGYVATACYGRARKQVR